MYICTGHQVLLQIRGIFSYNTSTWGRERAFEDLKKGQVYVAETLKKDTKDN